MKIKSIVPGAAIVLVATIGSVSAADQFTTIAGFEAQNMTKQEMEETRGSYLSYWDAGYVLLDVTNPSNTGTNLPPPPSSFSGTDGLFSPPPRGVRQQSL